MHSELQFDKGLLLVLLYKGRLVWTPNFSPKTFSRGSEFNLESIVLKTKSIIFLFIECSFVCKTCMQVSKRK